jgi:hypothetical protein
MPANGATDVSINTSFVWTAVPTANWYRIQVSTDPNFVSIVASGRVSTVSFTPSNSLAYGTRYYYRVQSENEFGSGEWSATWYFTTRQAPNNPQAWMSAPDSVFGGIDFLISLSSQYGVSATLNGENAPLNGVVIKNISVTTEFVYEVTGEPGTTPAIVRKWVYIKLPPAGCGLERNITVNGLSADTIRVGQTAHIRVFGGNTCTDSTFTGGGVHGMIPVPQGILGIPLNFSHSPNVTLGYGGPPWQNGAVHFNAGTLRPGDRYWFEFDVPGISAGVQELRFFIWSNETGWLQTDPVDITVIP